MIKASRLLHDDLEIDENMIYEMNDEDNQEKCFSNDLSNLIESTVQQSPNLKTVVNIIRCGAHTLQLAVHDVLKSVDILPTIIKCRELVKYLMTSNIKILLRAHNISKKPILDNSTRWNSTYAMLERLLEYKLFCNDADHIANYPKLVVEENVWEFIEEFILVFKPVYICTKMMQEEQYPLSDFFKSWLELRFNIKKIPGQLARSLEEALCTR